MSTPIKIAFVRGSYLNNFEAQNYVLQKQKFSLTAFASKTSLHKTLPFPVIRLPSLHDLPIPIRLSKIVANRTIGDNQNLFGIENFAQKFDIFHTADPHYYYSYQLAKMRASGLISSLIVTSWETIPFNNESVKAKQKIKRFTIQQADLFVCYTEVAKRTLVQEGVDEKKIEVVPLGIDIRRFHPRVGSNDTLTLLTVCRLVEEKGIIEVYQIFKELLKVKNIRLVIAGSGPLKVQLEQLIKRDKLEDRVEIISQSYEHMPDVYRSADIFLLFSKRTKTWEEQYGMVVLEAMASGLPVCVTDSLVSREVIGEAGIYVELNSLNLTHSLAQLILSHEMRLKFGSQARHRAEELYDSREFSRKIGTIYTNEKAAADRRRAHQK